MVLISASALLCFATIKSSALNSPFAWRRRSFRSWREGCNGLYSLFSPLPASKSLIIDCKLPGETLDCFRLVFNVARVAGVFPFDSNGDGFNSKVLVA